MGVNPKTTHVRARARREDAALLRGEGAFVHNLSLPDECHVAFARSNYGYGLIEAIDLGEARDMAGVVDVLLASDFAAVRMPKINPLLELASELQFALMADREIQYVGQVVAMVVARSLATAQRAAASVTCLVNTDGKTPHRDFDPDGRLVAALPSDGGEHLECDGIAEAAEVASVDVVETSVRINFSRVQALAMEPRATSAHWSASDEQLTVWLGTQAPSRAQADLAQALRVSLQQVRVITPDVGGAFGAKASIYPEDVLIALAARRLNKSLSWRSTRGEEFCSAMQGRASQLQGKLTVNRHGKFVKLSAQLHFALGAWLPFSAVVPLRNAARILPGPYFVPARKVSGQATLSHAAAVNIYRGAGRPEAAVLMESLVDGAARALKIDPLELRQLNLIPESMMPFATLSGEVLDSGNYLKALERAGEAFAYVEKREQQALRRAKGELLGIGMAVYVEPCGAGWESARVTLHADGQVKVASGSPAQGQGHGTSFAAIAAQTLGCDPGLVSVIYGDTETCPQGLGSLASRSMAIGGSAIVKACQLALEKKAQGADFPITVDARFDSKETWAYGCMMAQMSVDRDTGRSLIEEVVWIDDAGTLIDPVLAHGQLLGGFAQGFGQAMMERMVYDDEAQLLTGSLMDYAVPRASDLPSVRIESQCHDATTNPLGAKGVGEAGCIGAPAVLMNALRDALVDFGELELHFPLSAEQTWRAMRGDGMRA